MWHPTFAQRNHFMKKIIALVVLALLGVATWYFWETRPKPNNEVAAVRPHAVSKHSAAFNQSVDSLLNAYYALSEALVNWDSSRVGTHTSQLKVRLGSLPINELQKDSLAFQSAQPTLAQVQQDVSKMASAPTLQEKRRTFHSLSQNMYDLLRTVHYDASTVYLQECPMAFNDAETGNWLSNTAAIRNPYLGLHHPKYKGGMLECGETKDSIGFAQGR